MPLKWLLKGTDDTRAGKPFRYTGLDANRCPEDSCVKTCVFAAGKQRALRTAFALQLYERAVSFSNAVLFHGMKKPAADRTAGNGKY